GHRGPPGRHATRPACGPPRGISPLRGRPRGLRARDPSGETREIEGKRRVARRGSPRGFRRRSRRRLRKDPAEGATRAATAWFRQHPRLATAEVPGRFPRGRGNSRRRPRDRRDGDARRRAVGRRSGLPAAARLDRGDSRCRLAVPSSRGSRGRGSRRNPPGAGCGDSGRRAAIGRANLLRDEPARGWRHPLESRGRPDRKKTARRHSLARALHVPGPGDGPAARPRPFPRVRSVEILREVLERGGRSTPLLAERSRGLSTEDSDLLRAITLGVLRNRAALDAEIASVSRVPLERLAGNLREILEVALYQIRYLDRVPDYAAVNEAVAHARAGRGPGAAGLVNAVLRNLLRHPPPPPDAGGDEGADGAGALSLRFSHPEFLVPRWLARFGPERPIRILEADNTPSGVDLLVNARRTSREGLAAALASEGILTRPSPLAPLGLTVVSGNALRSPLFAAGQFSIQ